MAESTLALTLTDLRIQVAYKLGYGRAYPSGTNQQNHVNAVINRALALFYWHPVYPVIPEITAAHKWSFLEPKTTIVAWDTTTGTTSGAPSYSDPSSTITATAAAFYPSMIGQNFTFDTSGTDYVIDGYTSSTVITVTGDASGEASGDTYTITATGDYRLPDDWGGIISRLVYSSNVGRAPLPWVAPEQILELRNDYTGTGYPQVAAVVAVSNDGTDGQRWNMMLHPTPGADYTFHYQYSVLPDALVDTSNEYPYGGTQYREALMAACEAVCEMEKIGQHAGMWDNFVSALHSAIVRDRSSTAGQEIGKNTCSDPVYVGNAIDWLRYNSNQTITIEGVTYS